ncbi:MAG TPA: glutathione S-transferase family protein [Eoetvoesiella sp.]|uniref:glutathione S-transferase family protein n=1 Tax=Eoetvoesiella sp. TaxID=1966355 RepID=UPI002BE19EAC|nr:glutathione S-transferase family protein [Eoetvoesiella sp.]HWK60534.1 glutathione S-transferase family protein [Eoetvoesiella sp.]
MTAIELAILWLSWRQPSILSSRDNQATPCSRGLTLLALKWCGETAWVAEPERTRMLELYHHGSSVCAAKVRLALDEKGLEWQGHYVDVLKGDQFSKDYLKINPKALVPALKHNGKIVTESTLICEYLDEVFPDIPLKPVSAFEKVQMRLWTKAVDEVIHPICGEITFASCHRHIVRRLPPDDLQRFLASTPSLSVTPEWHDRKKELVNKGFDAPGIDVKFRIYDGYLQKMEETLAERRWLAGDTFSLADIGMVPYVNRLAMMSMSDMWEKSRPRVTQWFETVKSRPSFHSALIKWCPEDLTNDLREFGAQSWPEVKRMLRK